MIAARVCLFCVLIHLIATGQVLGQQDWSKLKTVNEVPAFDSQGAFLKFLLEVDPSFKPVFVAETDDHFVAVLYRQNWLAVCDWPRREGGERLSFTSVVNGRGGDDIVIPYSQRDKGLKVPLLAITYKVDASTSRLIYMGELYVVREPLALESIIIDLQSVKIPKIELADFISGGGMERIAKLLQ